MLLRIASAVPGLPLSLFLAFSLVAPAPSRAQDARPEPRCAECRFAFDSLTTLGATEGDGALRTGPAAIVEDADGRFVVAQRVENEPARVFAPDGSFVATIGTIGDGPGEYRSIGALSATEEAIHLYDEGTQRISTVDLNLELQGTIPLRGFAVMDAVALGPGLHVVNMIVPGGPSGGHALHLVNDEGEIIRSIEPFDSRDGDPFAHFRHVFRPEGGDGFWSVPYFGRIVARRYSSDGDLLMEWSAAPAPGDELPMTYGNPDEDRPPTRQILAPWHDDGLLWVVSTIPGPRWRDGLTRAEDGVHGTYFKTTDHGLLFDPAMEVFDADTGELVVARYAESLPISHPVGPGIGATMSTDELGWVFLTLRRARLIGAR